MLLSEQHPRKRKGPFLNVPAKVISLIPILPGGGLLPILELWLVWVTVGVGGGLPHQVPHGLRGRDGWFPKGEWTLGGSTRPPQFADSSLGEGRGPPWLKVPTIGQFCLLRKIK